MRLKPVLMAVALTALATAFLQCAKERHMDESGYLVPKTADEDPSLPSISVNGAILHAEAFGHPDSNLLLVLHGGPGADYRYLLNCKAFADQGYRVVFYDQRGSGLSQRFSYASYTNVQFFYDDLKGVIDHYRTSPNQKVFLLGHSWGAMLATGYINQYPTEIAGAILCEPGGFSWDDIVGYVNRITSPALQAELTSDALYPDMFITGKTDQHAILDYKYSLLAVGEGREGSPTGDVGIEPSWRSGYTVNRASFDIGNRDGLELADQLDQYAPQILFIYSERNTAYGEAYAQKVSAPYKNKTLYCSKGMGHNMLSFPKGWADCFPIMLNYLNEVK